MKINKRLAIIFGLSGAVAVVLSGILYYILLTEADPVKQIGLPVLTVQLEKDAVIQEGNIKVQKFNADTVPTGVIRDKNQIVGKQLSVKLHPGEFIFSSDIAERGEVSEPLKKLYIIGVDVNNISNFLGTQLEIEGVYYVLTENENIEVSVAGLIDSTGNAVFGEHQVQIETVNLGVKTMKELKLLKQLELAEGIELIKYPDK